MNINHRIIFAFKMTRILLTQLTAIKEWRMFRGEKWGKNGWRTSTDMRRKGEIWSFRIWRWFTERNMMMHLITMQENWMHELNQEMTDPRLKDYFPLFPWYPWTYHKWLMWFSSSSCLYLYNLSHSAYPLFLRWIIQIITHLQLYFPSGLLLFNHLWS